MLIYDTEILWLSPRRRRAQEETGFLGAVRCSICFAYYFTLKEDRSSRRRQSPALRKGNGWLLEQNSRTDQKGRRKKTSDSVKTEKLPDSSFYCCWVPELQIVSRYLWPNGSVLRPEVEGSSQMGRLDPEITPHRCLGQSKFELP